MEINDEIMNELLSQPGVAENVKQMDESMLEWFKKTLVREGIYAKYVKEREDK